MYPDSSIICYGGLNRIVKAGSDGWMEGARGCVGGGGFGSGKEKAYLIFPK